MEATTATVYNNNTPALSAHTNNDSSANSSSGEGPKIEAVKYKTKMCKNWMTKGECPYYEKCMFAHGDYELRSVSLNTTNGLMTEDDIRRFRRSGAGRAPLPQQRGLPVQSRPSPYSAPYQNPYPYNQPYQHNPYAPYSSAPASVAETGCQCAECLGYQQPAAPCQCEECAYYANQRYGSHSYPPQAPCQCCAEDPCMAP